MLPNSNRGKTKRLREVDKTSTRDYSHEQEVRVAEILGGKVVVNSGATPFKKGDVETDSWLIECKTTMSVKESMSVKAEWLRGIKEEAIGMRKKHSAVVISMDMEHDYVVLPIDEFVRLLEE